MDPLQIKTIVTRPGMCFLATASTYDQDGGYINDRDITWRSSNPTVAFPEKNYSRTVKIWSKKPGQATITASCETAFQTFIVKVEALKPLDIQISFTEPR